MIYLSAIFVFLLGIVIGSFLNVVIYRYNTGMGVNGRSKCLSCGKQLSWYELFPVLSFLVQGGKCRKCKTKLSWQYPTIELLTALVFLGTFLHLSKAMALYSITLQLLLLLVVTLAAWSLLIVILAYDIKHKIIPDGLVYSFAALGLISIFLSVPLHPYRFFYGALLAGPILFLPFFLLWLVSAGKWIGLGDGKLALGIGWMLGLGLGISAVVLAFWIGAIASLFIMLVLKLRYKDKMLTMKSEIPFAPYLILGFAIVYFMSVDVMSIHAISGF